MQQGQNRPERLLSVKEVAKILHVHPNTLRAWCKRGLISYYRIGSRGDRRFDPDEIARFLDSSRQPGRTPDEIVAEELLEGFTPGPDGGLAPPELRNMYTSDS